MMETINGNADLVANGGRRVSRQSLYTTPSVVRLEGKDVHPAKVEGTHDVFRAPKFLLVKSRWIGDEEVSTCAACGLKFSQLRRKHHCRQCGQVFCTKCCNEKVPLPQVGCEEAERVCELCRPIAELVTKSRSSNLPSLLESVKGLAQASRDPKKIGKVVELGGIQALVTLSLIDSVHIRRYVTFGLHALSTHPSLHTILADSGAIKAVCKVLSSVGESEDDTLCDGISALLVFCKSQELKTKALEDGALGPVLSVCAHKSPAPALLALSTLAHIAEHAGTHEAIVDGPKQALPRILAITASADEQMQEVALKTLAHLSMGDHKTRHRIVQEDFSCGRCLLKALSSKPKNGQILSNAACLVANLATSAVDQGALQDLMVVCCSLLQSDPSNTELLCHLTRALANFANFRQNAERLISHVPTIVNRSFRSSVAPARAHALRFLLSLLAVMPARTTQLLIIDGATEVLEGLGAIPGLIDTIRMPLLADAPEKTKPL